VWDRVEIFSIFTPNDLNGYELWETTVLVSSTGEWSALSNGTVRLQLWSAYPTVMPLYVMTDAAVDVMESYITIPFVTSYRGMSYEGNGTCGNVVVMVIC
jgi:hypothetical protein